MKIVGLVISGAFTGGAADVAEAAGNDILATILGTETAGSMVFTDRMMMNEGQQGQQLPQHLPQTERESSYCDPAVMAGMHLHWRLGSNIADEQMEPPNASSTGYENSCSHSFWLPSKATTESEVNVSHVTGLGKP